MKWIIFQKKKQTKGRSFRLKCFFFTSKCQTSRERPQSASYLKLNNIQGETQPIVKFFIYHTAENALETSEKNYLPLRKIKIFQKRVW